MSLRGSGIRTGAVAFVAAVLGLSAAGCDVGEVTPDTPEYVTMCMDPRTDERVADDKCPLGDDGEPVPGGTFAMFFVSTSSGYTAPPVGSRIHRPSGTLSKPVGVSTIHYGKVPAAGGTISRGGFGVPGGRAGSSGG